MTRKSKQVENPYKKGASKKSAAFDGEVFDKAFDEEFSNVVASAGTAAMIIAAMGVLSSIISVLGKNKDIVGEMPLTEQDRDMIDKAPVSELTAEEIAQAQKANGGSGSNGESGQILGMPSTVVYVGGALMAALVIGLIIKSNKNKGK